MAGDRVAYAMVKFPQLTETFVAREIAAMKERGWEIEITPLWLERGGAVHDDVRPLLPLVRWTPLWTPGGVRQVVRMIGSRPRAVASALWMIASQFPRHPEKVVVSLGLFPIMLSIGAGLERRGVRHVHAHFAGHPALTALVVQRLTGISFSFTGHAHDLYVSPMLLPEKVRAATFVVAISDYNRRLIERAANDAPTPVEVVHCGVVTPVELPESQSDAHEIVCVGRLDEKKGQRYLIEACRILHARGIAVRCTFVGGGPDEKQLRQQVGAAGLADTLTFTGPITSDDVQARLRRASAFILPSVVTASGNAEGIPVALMEAMALGLPVISTMTTGIPELIEHDVSGVLVEPRDPVALADAIARVLGDDALRDRLRVAGFEKVRDEFDLNASADQLSALFESVGLSRSG